MSRWISIFVLLAAFGLLVSSAQAQTVPNDCQVGGARECAQQIPGPFQYESYTCSAPYDHPTEAAAMQRYLDWTGLASCITTNVPRPWLALGQSSGTYYLHCTGNGNYTPGSHYGEESSNRIIADITGKLQASQCGTPQPSALAAIGRSRTFHCPDGYSQYVNNVCARTHTTLDPAKNYGEPPCKKSGDCVTRNPINIAMGNKFRAETDYAAAGTPLTFVRYYNSIPLNRNGSGFFRQTTFESARGLSAYASLYNEPSEQAAGPYRLLEPGVIGVGWRHRYQRNVIRRTTAMLTSANFFTASGRVVTASKANGVWSFPADIKHKLNEFTDVNNNLTGWRVDLEDGSSEFFDAQGRLTSIRHRSGVEEIISFDTQCDRVSHVTDSFGNVLSFTYEEPCLLGNHRIASITVPGGRVYSYQYDTNGLLVGVTAPDLTQKTYHYENTTYPAALTGITDESGTRYATFAYDARGRASLSTLAGGAEQVSIAYLPSDSYKVESAVLTTASGATASYVFDVHRGMNKVASQNNYCDGCPGNVKSLTYDTNGNVTRKRDFLNQSTCYAYDVTRNLETVRVEGFASTVSSCPSNLANYTPASNTRQRKITTAWHATLRVPTSITEAKRTTTFTHDASGNVLTRTVTDTSVTPNVSRTWTYTYNTFGRVLTEDGPRTDVNDVTTYAYYTCTTGAQCGQLQSVTNALSHVTTYDSYNVHGQLTQSTSANGLVTRMAYDVSRRLTDRCVNGFLPGCVGGELTHLDYWPTGLLKKVTNPDGSYVEYLYDAAHRLTEVKDGAFNRVVFTLDAMGNRTVENTYDPSNALRRTHSRVYNTLNQLWKDVNAAGTANVTTTFGYDVNGDQNAVNAPLGRNSSNLYDELRRLKQITDPASGITKFAYDAGDNLTSVTDPRNLVTSYTYSGFDDLKTQTSPDTGATTNTYDSGGNLDTSTDSRGAIADYAYDALNRVTSVSFTLGGVTDQTITYGYDAGTNQNGLLTSATDAQHALAWTYDSQGRVTGKGQTVGGITLAIGYGFNSSGQLASRLLPSGASIAYGYNTNGELTSLTLNGSTTILDNITYDPFGPVTGWSWGNGTTASRDFDADGKVTQVDDANGASLKTYSYDDAFRITGVTDVGNSALSWTYGYDLLDRLNSATSSSVTQGWTYDANGNRLTQTGSTPSTYTNSLTSNRVGSVSGAMARTYGYDAAGNTLSYAGATFTYNHRGRMTSASNAGTTATYTYNALGQRIRRATSASTTIYVYDEAGHLVGEYTASGALIQETVWMGDTPVATLRPNGSGGVVLYYVHSDHLHTPRLVTDTSNNVRWRWDSDAFGATVPNENPSGLGMFEYNLRFPGQQYDAVAGLHYNYFRDYDPAVGRYVESDPIGLAGGLNTYGYVNANPVALSDPTGLVPGRTGMSKSRECAGRVFTRNYWDMREANWKRSDKYFHCKANCEAARCGPDGYDEACRISDTREKLDQLSGDPPSASADDQRANRYGRDNSLKNPNVTCAVVCAPYRPPGLPAKY